jgi:hypothetical protein
MRHLVLALLILIYWVVVGAGHTWVFVALMLATLWRDYRESTRGTHAVTLAD